MKRMRRAVWTMAGGLLPLVGFMAVWAATGPAEEPVRGGTLVMAVSADPPTFNTGITTDTQAWFAAGKIFNGLTFLDRDLNNHPDLAESWEVAPDGMTYTFRLRPGVRWHDGKPFTSKDVQFTYLEILAKYHPIGKLAFSRIRAIDTPDDHTAVIHMKEPYAPLLYQTTEVMAPILPRHIYEGTDILNNPHNKADPVGTGPFRLGEYVRGSHVTLVRNPDYFKKGQPYLDRVILKIMPNGAARVLAFEKGEVDVLYGFVLPREQALRLKALPGVQYAENVVLPEVVTLFFNLQGTKPLADLRVRQAIAHGLDKKFMIEKAYFGVGRPATSPIPTGIPWAHNKSVAVYDYDPEKAQALLDAAGFPRKADGTRLSLRLAYDPANSAVNKVAEIAAQQLRQVGIAVKLDPMERSVLLNKIFVQYDYDLFVHNYTTYGDPAVGVSRAYTCENVRPAPFVNVERYCNPKVDELFQAGATRVDKRERAKAYYAVQEILVRDLPTFPLLEYPDANVAKANVHGLFRSPSSHERWDEAWLAKPK